jgi:hypothetical protein
VQYVEVPDDCRTTKKVNWQQVGYVGCQGSVGLFFNFSSFFSEFASSFLAAFF